MFFGTYLSTKDSSKTAAASEPAAKAAGKAAEINNRVEPENLRSAWGLSSTPAFDVGKMKHLLDHDNHEMRNDFREFIKGPLFQPRFDLTLEEEREVALRIGQKS